MIEVIIKYQVADKEGQPFRPLSDIARDVEDELLRNALFSEASYYKIIVSNKSEHSIIECF